jgi:hypothetical protein
VYAVRSGVLLNESCQLANIGHSSKLRQRPG